VEAAHSKMLRVATQHATPTQPLHHWMRHAQYQTLLRSHHDAALARTHSLLEDDLCQAGSVADKATHLGDMTGTVASSLPSPAAPLVELGAVTAACACASPLVAELTSQTTT